MAVNPSPLVPFLIPAYPCPITLSQARVDLPPEEFRLRLRRYLLDYPGLTLAQVAQSLGVTRQRVGLMAGRLDRPDCAHRNRPALHQEAAREKLMELRRRVAAGEPAASAAKELGISLNAAMKLGFRTKDVRPPHGSQARAVSCDCWRCRRAAGLAHPRGPRIGPERQAEVLDWLAWTDPDSGEGLTQVQVGKLTGMAQGAVSRIARMEKV